MNDLQMFLTMKPSEKYLENTSLIYTGRHIYKLDIYMYIYTIYDVDDDNGGVMSYYDNISYITRHIMIYMWRMIKKINICSKCFALNISSQIFPRDSVPWIPRGFTYS